MFSADISDTSMGSSSLKEFLEDIVRETVPPERLEQIEMTRNQIRDMIAMQQEDFFERDNDDNRMLLSLYNDAQVMLFKICISMSEGEDGDCGKVKAVECAESILKSLVAEHAKREERDRMKNPIDETSGVIPDPSTIDSSTAHHLPNGLLDEILGAWKQLASRRGVPQRAQRLLEEMEAASSKSLPTDHSLYQVEASRAFYQPTVQSYNLVLATWSNSSEHLRGTMAQDLFHKLRDRKDLKSDDETFRIMIRAWCRSSERRSAFNATSFLMRMVKAFQKHKEEMEPTMEEYQMVLQAWVTAADKDAPLKAESVFHFIEEAFAKDLSENRADVLCYRYLLQTWASHSKATTGRSGSSDPGDVADHFFRQMKSQDILPDSECYSAAIQCHVNAAHHPSENERPSHSARRAHMLLEEMSQAYYRSSTVLVEPRTADYNQVLRGWTAVIPATAQSQMRSEALLLRMEQSDDGDDDASADISEIAPDAESYAHVLTILSNVEPTTSVWVDQAENVPGDDDEEEESIHEKAINILQRMEERAGSGKLSPSITAYNAFVAVCANHAAHQQQQQGITTTTDGADMLRQAIGMVENLVSKHKQDYDAVPNSRTFLLLLKTAHSSFPPAKSKERIQIAEGIFRSCCARGCVTKDVLDYFRSIVSEDVYRKIVFDAATRQPDGSLLIPETWSRNSSSIRRTGTTTGMTAHHTASNRTTAGPKLTVDGKYTVTMETKERKMATLRSQQNKKLLQGGRMQHKGKYTKV